MDSVGIAVGAELFQFHSASGIPPIFGRGIAGYSGRSLIVVGTTLSAFQRNDDSDTFSHGSRL